MKRRKVIVDNFWRALSSVCTIFVVANMLSPLATPALRPILLGVFSFGIGLGIIYNVGQFIQNLLLRTSIEFLVMTLLYFAVIAISHSYPLTIANIGLTFGIIVLVFLVTWTVQYYYYRYLVAQVNGAIHAKR